MFLLHDLRKEPIHTRFTFFRQPRTYSDAPRGLTLAGNAHVVWECTSNAMRANSVNNFYKAKITYF